MGTSRGYKMPTGGNWTPLKNDATDFVQGNNSLEVNSGSVVTAFLRANGGYKSLGRGNGGTAPSSGSSGGGGGGKKGSTKSSAAVGTARNLGGFLSRVADSGLDAALKESGLEALVGKPAGEVADALLDQLAGPASTLDNATAREALADLKDELLGDAETYEEMEERLQKAMDENGLFGILASFFGFYVYNQFCRNFYEDWQKKVGQSRTVAKLAEIKDYMQSSLRTKLAGKQLSNSDWKGEKGARLAEEVLRETLIVFGVTT